MAISTRPLEGSAIEAWIEKASDNAISFQDKNISIFIHVLIDYEDNFFTAHCLELDIAVDGNSAENAKENCINAIVNHISFCLATENTDKILNQAPKEYFGSLHRDKFQFPADYKYKNIDLPFMHKIIKGIEFGSKKSLPIKNHILSNIEY